MGKFDQHFKMDEADAIEYIREKLDFFPEGSQLICREIGDGNINYVFRVMDEKTGKSVIIKHADTMTRSTGGQVSTDRNRIEAEILKKEKELAPEFVPEVYLYDPVMCCLIMEDLKDYGNMRYELISHHTFSTFADDITTFMANTLIGTTDIVLTPAEKKKFVKNFINPTLCRITESLVYTEPYLNLLGKNVLNPDNELFFIKELYEDQELHLEVAKLKESFKGKAQALIHGDLHTGSIFVKEGSTMVLDPEFACYGPIGYDVGNVAANLLFAWANAEVTMEEGTEKQQFHQWLEKTISDVIDLFKSKAEKIMQSQCTEPMARVDGFVDWYLSDILSDTAGVAGLELNRRIVGSAKVKDIAGIKDRKNREMAEKICVLTAKELIMKRESNFFRGCDYVEAVRRNTKLIRK